jgi:hypothetical protein
MYRLLWVLALLGLLAGCGAAPKPAPAAIDSDIEEAQDEMQESKQEYEGCLRDSEEAYDDMDCEVFKEIYEEDREAYENLIRLKKAGR